MWPYWWDQELRYHCLRKNNPVEHKAVMPASVVSDKEKENIMFANQTVKASHLFSAKRMDSTFAVKPQMMVSVSSLQVGPHRSSWSHPAPSVHPAT